MTASDLSHAQRRQLLDAVRNQIGSEEYETLRRHMSEDELIERLFTSASKPEPPPRESAWVRALAWPLAVWPLLGAGFWGVGLTILFVIVAWIADRDGSILAMLFFLYVSGVIWEGVFVNLYRLVTGRRRR